MSDGADEERVWYAYENGASLGRPGPAGGIVRRDEELGDKDDPEDADARLTLEQEGSAFMLTAQLYPWMLHTRAADDAAAADAAFEAMRPELSRLAALIPYDDDPDIAGRVAALEAAIEAFTRRFPGQTAG